HLGLYRVPESSPIVAHLPDRRRWRTFRQWREPYLDLTPGTDVVRGALRPNFVKQIAYRRRRLEKLGSLTFVDRPAEGPDDPLLAAGLRLEVGGWKGTDGDAVLGDE